MPGWVPTGNLNWTREEHTSTLLHDGTVLVHGGEFKGTDSTTTLSTADLFDPGSGTWTATGRSIYQRSGHTATLLQNGKVLVVGGLTALPRPPPPPLQPGGTELYNPFLGRWEATAVLNHPRYGQAATLLSDGRVLVVGGDYLSGVPGSCEIFVPVTLGWAPTGTLVNRLAFPESATLLMDGRVLAVTGNEAELYDPATGSWTRTGSLSYSAFNSTATRLGDGTVLVTGGMITQPHNASANNAELYDPTTGAWSPVGNLNKGRSGTRRPCCPLVKFWSLEVWNLTAIPVTGSL